MRAWEIASRDIDALNGELHYGLEPQRKAQRNALLEALQKNAAPPLEFAGWHRIVPYRYCNSPLSAAGSLRNVGGRFNVGDDLADAGFAPWPALYLASTFETAYREKFQLDKDVSIEGISPEELALNPPNGWTVCLLKGRIEVVFDVGSTRALTDITKIFATFKMPPQARDIAQRLRIRNLALIRTASQLSRMVLHRQWRVLPVQFDLPSHSQILGGLIREAGFEAVVYPSAKNGERCLAVFPGNFGHSGSFTALDGEYPDAVEFPRLDGTTSRLLV